MRDDDHERFAHGGPGQLIYMLVSGVEGMVTVDRGSYFELWTPAERKQAEAELERVEELAASLRKRIQAAP